MIVQRNAAARAATPRMVFTPGPAAIAMVMSVVALLPIYLSTAAPDLTFWDAPEFITAAHTLGIPHPPGTPLWVMAAKVSSILFSARGPASSVTMLSVIATVFACALGARLVARWIHGTAGAIAGFVAALTAGTMTSVWANATETEVYAMSLLFSVAMISAGDRAGQAGVTDKVRERSRALIAFVAGMAVPMHLSVMVALPPAVVFAWHGPRPKTRELAAWVALFALGFSAVAILPILANRDPLLNSGNPIDLQSLYAVLTRAQYEVAGLWPRRAPLWIQFGNVFEWADWQVALGLRPTVGPSWVRTPLTVAWALFGMFGLRHLWRIDRRVGRGLAALLLCAIPGVVVWLNLRAGTSFGDGFLPPGALHEARERDYFFALGFWTWGVLAGTGIAALSAAATARLSPPVRNATRTAMLAAAAIPLIANASVMDRAHEPESLLPRMLARVMLESVPLGGILVTAGDNDSYPLWYLQQVEDVRSDVTVITSPMLPAVWHRQAIMKRGVVSDSDFATVWHGRAVMMATIGRNATAKNKALRVSTYLSRVERNQLLPGSGWLLQGVVYAPSDQQPAGTVGLDTAMMARVRAEIPPAFLDTLSDFEGSVSLMQRLLRCPGVTSLADPLLAGPCNGS
ncbi:MAG: DUF2723 domain-containing protein [Gemmatimonas sp.]